MAPSGGKQLGIDAWYWWFSSYLAMEWNGKGTPKNPWFSWKLNLREPWAVGVRDEGVSLALLSYINNLYWESWNSLAWLWTCWGYFPEWYFTQLLQKGLIWTSSSGELAVSCSRCLGDGPQGLQVRSGWDVGLCKARRRCNSVKAGLGAFCFPLVPQETGIRHLGNSHKPLGEPPLLFSWPGLCQQTAELAQLLILSVGPIFLLAVRSHLMLKYLRTLRNMLGHEECKG